MSGQPPVAEDRAAALADLLPRRRGRRLVVLLAGPEQREALRPWLRVFARDRVRVIGPGAPDEWGPDAPRKRLRRAEDLAEVGAVLRRIGAPDVILSLMPDEHLPEGAADQVGLWRELFGHVRSRGAWVVDLEQVGVGAVEGLRDRLVDDQTEVSEVGDDAGLVRSVGEVASSDQLFAVTKRLRHYLKTTEEDPPRSWHATGASP